MKVYISGQITGCDDFIDRFYKAHDELKKKGHEVFNPVDLVPYRGDKLWIEYMIQDIILLSVCDAIFMLNNWKQSKGAKIEHDLAVGMGIEIIYQE